MKTILLAAVSVCAASALYGGDVHRLVDSVYDALTPEERVAQICATSAGNLAGSDGRFSAEKARARIPHGIGHVCQFYIPLPDELRAKCRRAFDRGIDCILRTQIRQDGKLALWCQQHDRDTLAPLDGVFRATPVGNIVLEDISATSAKAVYSFRGYTTEPIRGLRLKNIKVGKAKNPSSAELVEDISVVDTPSFRCLRKVGMVIQFGNGMRTSYTELLCLI